MADPGNSTTELSDTTSDVFHCPICLEGIRNPKYLPCLHTFCGSCIENYISSTAKCRESEIGRAIECPICRKRIEAPTEYISNEEWSSALPQNKLVANMCLISTKIENELCKICQRKGKTVSGSHWCKVYMETICDDCKDLHKFVPSLQNHKIVTIADSGECRNGVEVEEFCAEHDGKVIDAFCYNHDNLCCSICLVKHHRTCLNVESLEDIGEEKEKTDVATILSSLSKMEKSLENMQLNIQAKISHLNTKKDTICFDTEKKIEEVKKKLDDAHEQWVKRFEQTHVDSVGNIEIVSDELKRFSTSVHETRILLQSLMANSSTKQLFITKHKQLAQMADHMSRMKSLDIWDIAEDYSQPNLGFLSQILNENKFKDVDLTKLSSGMIETILQMAPVAMANEYIMRRRRQIDPSSLKIFDVSTATGKCVHTENCESRPYDLCHARGALNLHEVYVSFNEFIVLYCIEFATKDVAIFTKLRTI
uniref:Transcription intermediary factor 1-beta-like n=1 Tax=Crassostrea virginica TaxID=6565 RepID=A0A8B8CKN7_CRAVI|nr:transcription intermediary factor 1-beta-like [Crassostrea virginica]